MFLAFEKKCFRITQNDVEEITALRPTHEEANAHQLLYLKHAVDTGREAVLLVCDDTDVFKLAVAQMEQTTPIFRKHPTKEPDK